MVSECVCVGGGGPIETNHKKKTQLATSTV